MPISYHVYPYGWYKYSFNTAVVHGAKPGLVPYHYQSHTITLQLHYDFMVQLERIIYIMIHIMYIHKYSMIASVQYNGPYHTIMCMIQNIVVHTTYARPDIIHAANGWLPNQFLGSWFRNFSVFCIHVDTQCFKWLAVTVMRWIRTYSFLGFIREALTKNMPLSSHLILFFNDSSMTLR